MTDTIETIATQPAASSYTRQDLSETLRRVNLHAAPVRVLGAWGVSGDYNEWTGGFALELSDGTYAYIEGWCDSTGWGCQDGVAVAIAASPAGLPVAPLSAADVPVLDHWPSIYVRPEQIVWDTDPADLNRWIAAGMPDDDELPLAPQTEHQEEQSTTDMTINEINDKKKDLKLQLASVQAQSRQLLIGGLQTLMKENPKIQSVRWTQYTDYFNDGSPCNFYAHLDEPEINGIHPGWVSSKTTEEKYDPYHPLVSAVLSQFDDNDYRYFFGDHKRITVTPEGVTIEEYTDHD